MSEPPVSSFGQYQLVEKIAQGGMAEIFKGKALDLHGLERPVVIKRILPHIAASPEFVQMLIDEAKIAVMLSHGNIAQIYDLGKVSDDYFIVMEYVEGKTISQIMKRLRSLGQQMSIPTAVYLCSEIAKGLDYMHRRMDDEGRELHIVHRDISPQNVILSTAGTVKIIDFGIAKAKTKISTTDSGILKGKFAYMSPEHAEGEKLDYRSDIFSLGVILFELLTNQRLFKGKNNLETVKKVRHTKVPVPSTLQTRIPKELDEIVLKALVKDRNKRYQSASSFAQDLTKFLVSQFPEFSPRELIPFLHELFPETAPEKNKGPQSEETPAGPLVIKKENAQVFAEPKEDTIAADTEILRRKLKQTEVFDVPDKRDVPAKEAIKPNQGFLHREKRYDSKKWMGIVFSGFAVFFFLFWGTKKSISIFQYWKIQKTVQKQEEQRQKDIQRAIEILNRKQKVEAPASSTASLFVDSNPKGAKIFIDDKDTNLKTPATLSELVAAQDHKIGLYLDHYNYWESHVQVREGKTNTLIATLEASYGDLEINSLPAGANILLNGQLVGKTPFQLSHLTPETTYDITLNLSGYEVWKRSVKIFSGHKEVIAASLKKLSE